MSKKKKEDFVHLHVHSDYSTLDGCGKISNYVKAIKKRNAPAIAFTEHGNMRGYYQEHKECDKHDIKPIYGIEFYVSNDMNRRGLTDIEKDSITNGLKKSEHKTAIKKYEEREGIRDRWHLTAWARNNKGLKNLFRLSTLAYTEGFYYKPRIDIKTLIKYSDGVSIGTGCASSVMHDRVFQGKAKKAFEIAEELRDKFDEHMWLEIQPHDFEQQVAANLFNLKLKERWGKKARFLATQDAHYVNSGDSVHHEVLLCIGTHDMMSNPNRFKFTGNEFFLKTRKQMRKTFLKNHPYMSKEQIKESLDNTILFAEQTDAKVNVDYHAALLPRVIVPKKFPNEWEYLKSLCRHGWKWRDMSGRIASTAFKKGRTFADMKAIYLERLSYELGTLYRQNFISYFLIVFDLYNWTRENGILAGPGRGSVAGSLVAFLLGFTCVDPLEHDLIFERFINVDRVDLPDIDMDFEDSRRQEILDYLRKKYGDKNVAQIATIGKLSGKQCVKDVSRVLGVPYSEAQEVTGSLIEVDGKKEDEDEGVLERAFSEVKVCKEFNKKYPDVLKHSKVLEGLAKTLGIHAAGIVVAPKKVENYVPLEVRKYKGQNVTVTALDKKGVAAMGLVKLDILGLRTLSVFKDCIEAIYDNRGEVINLEELLFDDKDVLDLFTKQDFSGVFQFDTNSMLKASKDVKFETFSDIVALNALNRPGTMRSGLTDQYVARKNDPEFAKKHLFHEKVSKITSDSLGIIVFQEHVIRILVEVAGYEANEADKVRKSIGGSEGDKVINKEREKFVKGAKKHSGLTEKEANKIMNAIVKFGSYSFNKTISGESWVLLADSKFFDNPWIKIKDLFKAQNLKNKKGRLTLIAKKINSGGIDIVQMDEDGYCRSGKLIKIYDHGVINCIQLVTKSGQVTPSISVEHRLMTIDGYKSISTGLDIGDKLLFMSEYKGYVKNGIPTFVDEIIMVIPVGKQHCFDLEMETVGHNYVATPDYKKYTPVVSHNSHSTAYAMNAYWGQWLKLYYPLEYYWALLKNEPQMVKIQTIAKDAKRKGIKILLPDVSVSGKSFLLDKNEQAIRGSLIDIKGVGDAAADQIIENQPYKNFIDFLSRVDRRKCHKGVVVALARSGALDSLLPNVKWFIENIENFWSKLNKKGLKSKEIKLDLLRSSKKSDYSKEEKQLVSIAVNPIAFSSHPLNVYKKFIKRNIKVKVVKVGVENFFKKYNNKTVFLIGIIQKKKISRIGDFHSGEVPNEEKRKKMFWGSQTASLFLEGIDNSHIRVKFDRDIFDEMLPVIDAGDGTPVLVSASVNNEYKSIRANYAINLETLRQKINKKEELDFWEKIVCGRHPILTYPWRNKKTKEKWTKNSLVEVDKKYVVFCGVVTNIKIKYDKNGFEMAFFGIQGLYKHLEVVCFATSWSLIRGTIEEKKFLIIQLEKSKSSRGVSYFFNSGSIKFLKKSSF